MLDVRSGKRFSGIPAGTIFYDNGTSNMGAAFWGRSKWHSHGPNLPKMPPKPLHVVKNVFKPAGITIPDLKAGSLYAILHSFNATLDAEKVAISLLLGRIDALASAAHAVHYNLVHPHGTDPHTFREPFDTITDAYLYASNANSTTYSDEVTVYQKMIYMWRMDEFLKHIAPIARSSSDSVVRLFTPQNFWIAPEPTARDVELRTYDNVRDSLGTPGLIWAVGHMSGPCTDPISGTRRPLLVSAFADNRGYDSDPLHNFGIHASLDDNHMWATDIHTRGGSSNSDGMATILEYHYVCCGLPLGTDGCLVDAPHPTVNQPVPYPWFGGWFDTDETLGYIALLASQPSPSLQIRRILETSASRARGTGFLPALDEQNDAHASMIRLLTSTHLVSSVSSAFVRIRNGNMASLGEAFDVYERTSGLASGTILDLLDTYTQARVSYNRHIFKEFDNSIPRDEALYARLFRMETWKTVSSVHVPPPGIVVPSPEVVIPAPVAPDRVPRIIPKLLLFSKLMLNTPQLRTDWLNQFNIVRNSTDIYGSDLDIIDALDRHTLGIFIPMAILLEYTRNADLITASDMKRIYFDSVDTDNDINTFRDMVTNLEQKLANSRDLLYIELERYNNEIIKPFNRIVRMYPDRRTDADNATMAGIQTYIDNLQQMPSSLNDADRILLSDDESNLQILLSHAKRVVERRKEPDAPQRVWDIRNVIAHCLGELETSVGINQAVTLNYIDSVWNTTDCAGKLSELLNRSLSEISNVAQRLKLLEIGFTSQLLEPLGSDVTASFGWFNVTFVPGQPIFRKWQLVSKLPEKAERHKSLFYIPLDNDSTTKSMETVHGPLIAFMRAYITMWENMLTQENGDNDTVREWVVNNLNPLETLAQNLVSARKLAFEDDVFEDASAGMLHLSPEAQSIIADHRRIVHEGITYMETHDSIDKKTRRGIRLAISKIHRPYLTMFEPDDVRYDILSDLTSDSRTLRFPQGVPNDAVLQYLYTLDAYLEIIQWLGDDVPDEVLEIPLPTRNDVMNVTGFADAYNALRAKIEKWSRYVNDFKKSTKPKQEMAQFSEEQLKTFEVVQERAEDALEDNDADHIATYIRDVNYILAFMDNLKDLIISNDNNAPSPVQYGIIANFRSYLNVPMPASMTQVGQGLFGTMVYHYARLFILMGHDVPIEMNNRGIYSPTIENVEGIDWLMDTYEAVQKSGRAWKAYALASQPAFTDDKGKEELEETFIPVARGMAFGQSPLYLNLQQLDDVRTSVLTYFKTVATMDTATDFVNAGIESSSLIHQSVGYFAILRNLIVSGTFNTNHIMERNQYGINRRQFNQLEQFMERTGFLNLAYDPRERQREENGAIVRDASRDQFMLSWGSLPPNAFENLLPDVDTIVEERRQRNNMARIGLPSVHWKDELGINITYIRWSAREMVYLVKAFLLVVDETKQKTLDRELDALYSRLEPQQRRLNRIKKAIQSNVKPNESNWLYSTLAWVNPFSNESPDEIPALPIPVPSAPFADPEDLLLVLDGPEPSAPELDDDETEEMNEGPRWVNGIDGTRVYIHDCAVNFTNLLNHEAYNGAQFTRALNNSCIGQFLSRIKTQIVPNLNQEQLDILIDAGSRVGAYSVSKGEWLVDGWLPIKSGAVMSTPKLALLVRREQGRIYVYNADDMRNLLRAWALFAELVNYITSNESANFKGELHHDSKIAGHIRRINDTKLNIIHGVFESSGAAPNVKDWQSIGSKHAKPQYTLENIVNAIHHIEKDNDIWGNEQHTALEWDTTIDQKYIHPILHALRDTVSSVDQGLVRRYITTGMLHHIGAIRNVGGHYRIISGITTQGAFNVGTTFFVGSYATGIATPYHISTQLLLLKKWGMFAELLHEIQKPTPNIQRLDALYGYIHADWINIL